MACVVICCGRKLCHSTNKSSFLFVPKILDAKGDTKGAIALLQKAATLEPDSKSIQQDLAKLIIKSRREERNEKEMYQKMLGQAKKFEQKNKKSDSINDIPKLKLLGYLMGSILIGVAGVAILNPYNRKMVWDSLRTDAIIDYLKAFCDKKQQIYKYLYNLLYPSHS